MGPTAMFSLLKGGARILPHTGVFNTRLICHLPLVVPPDCGFRVGNQTREWEVGKLIVFDDTIEHEAWNSSGEDRIVLIFDIWRPELSVEERHEVSALLAFSRLQEL
jgi:aspartyl/asparaginyl beta-hydroxylase (cupin superfamily)